MSRRLPGRDLVSILHPFPLSLHTNAHPLLTPIPYLSSHQSPTVVAWNGIQAFRDLRRAYGEHLSSSNRSALNAHPGFFNKFEICQLIYLRPQDRTQAVALIPR